MGTKCIITACFGADSGAGVAQAWIVDAPGAMRHWSDQSLRKREKEHSTLAAREDAVAGGPEEELGEARELFAGGEGGGAGEGSGGDGGGAGGDGAAAGEGLQLPGGLGLVIKPVALPSPRTTAADWLLTSPRCVSPHCFCHSFPLTFPPFFSHCCGHSLAPLYASVLWSLFRLIFRSDVCSAVPDSPFVLPSPNTMAPVCGSLSFFLQSESSSRKMMLSDEEWCFFCSKISDSERF